MNQKNNTKKKTVSGKRKQQGPAGRESDFRQTNKKGEKPKGCNPERASLEKKKEKQTQKPERKPLP